MKKNSGFFVCHPKSRSARPAIVKQFSTVDVAETPLCVQGVEFWSVNTDSQALDASSAPNRVQIGDRLTRGLGTGGNPELGESAAEESRDLIQSAVGNADL
eukprot:533339-Pyramimonas_sp.AAC.1